MTVIMETTDSILSDFKHLPQEQQARISSTNNVRQLEFQALSQSDKTPRARTSRLRSTGCKTCRLRKIKCDEARPTCRNCSKSQRTCLGYHADALLNRTKQASTSKPTMVPQAQSNSSLAGLPDGVASNMYGSYPPITSAADARQWDIEAVFRKPEMTPATVSPIARVHSADTDLTVSPSNRSYMWDTNGEDEVSVPLEHPAGQRANLLRITSAIPTSANRLETFFFQHFINSVWLHSQADSWKANLPGVLNQSSALYYSVVSLSALFMSTTGVDVRARDMALSLYQMALSHLQKALYDPNTAFLDTTLMATLILGFYELIDKPGHDWCAHSRGTAELMKLRGPIASSSGMGRMVFRTFRGFEVVRAILQQETTFVADEEWTVFSADPQTIASSGGILKPEHEYDEGHDVFVSTPKADPDYAAVLFMLGGQVANFQAACVQAARAGPLNHDLSKEFLQQAEFIEERLRTWRACLPANYDGRERLSVLEASPYITVQDFDSVMIAYQLIFYSAFLLLLHRTVAKYIYNDVQSIPETDQDHASFIVKTAESMTQGLTTASLNATWPLYMASISLREEREQRWTMSLLRCIVQDKGWSVANAALRATKVITQKNLSRRSGSLNLS